jgi:hypothetical protein
MFEGIHVESQEEEPRTNENEGIGRKNAEDPTLTNRGWGTQARAKAKADSPSEMKRSSGKERRSE